MKNKRIVAHTMKKALITAMTALLLLMATFFPATAWSQGDCGPNLARAQQLYNEGKLQQVAPLLNNCLKSGFTQEERIKAYRLLTLSYLFTNELVLADETFEKLLRLAPDFKIDKITDPATLQHLYQSYRTSPVFSVSLLFGPNQTLVRRSQINGPTNTVTESGGYSTKMGFQAGLAFNFYLNKHISLQLQGLSTTRIFTFENRLLDYSNLSYQEKHQLIEIPITVFYHFGKNKILPYVFAGAKYQGLLSAKADIIRQQDISRNIDVNGFDVIAQRRKVNMELLFGAGFQYRIKRIGLFLQASVGSGIFEQNLANKRYNLPDLAYRYGYVDDDFATDHIGVQIGVTYSIYNPRKLKNKKFEELREIEQSSENLKK